MVQAKTDNEELKFFTPEKTKSEFEQGNILTTEQFKKYVNESGTVDSIDFSKWNAKDCVSKDVELPADS